MWYISLKRATQNLTFISVSLFFYLYMQRKHLENVFLLLKWEYHYEVVESEMIFSCSYLFCVHSLNSSWWMLTNKFNVYKSSNDYLKKNWKHFQNSWKKSFRIFLSDLIFSEFPQGRHNLAFWMVKLVLELFPLHSF